MTSGDPALTFDVGTDRAATLGEIGNLAAGLAALGELLSVVDIRQTPVPTYRGTSLISNRHRVGPYSMTMPRVLRGS